LEQNLGLKRHASRKDDEWMKKQIATVLVLAMAATLGACSQIRDIDLPPLPTVTPKPAEVSEEPPAEATTQPETEQKGSVMVSIANTHKEAYDPQNGSQLILSFSYDTPSVYIEGNEEASAKINERIATMDEAYYTGNDYGDGAGTGYNNMLTMAEDNYNIVVSSGIEGAMLELVSSRTVSVERIDSQVLTLLYNDYMFTGGAHGNYGSDGYCFDTVTGEMLSLEGLSQDADGLKSFLTEYMVQAVESDEELAARIDLAELSVEGATYADLLSPLLRQGSWYFNREGMVIFSDLYEISSYASGPVSFTIPYEALKGHIDEKWLPITGNESGSMRVTDDAGMVDGSTQILDKLIVDEDGQQFYLIAEGAVCNVRIARGEYSNSFYETAQLWCCSRMEDCAIQLITVIPEGMPDLKISYDGANGQQVLYLTHSGEDGTVVLTDTVEPVG